MAFRDEVLQILRSTEASRIGFSFRSVRNTPVSVDATTFMRVVSAIESNRIQVSSEVLGRHDGEYDYRPENGGVIHARPIRNRRYRKAVIIHEAVHASFDLTRSIVPAVDDEVAAYLAQTLYLRFTHYSRESDTGQRTGPSPLYRSVWRAAGSVMQNGAATESQLQEIRARLMNHSTYRTLLLTRGCSEEEDPCFYVRDFYNG